MYNFDPQPQEVLDMEEGFESEKQLILQPVLSGELFKRVVNYPIIVEMWKKGKSWQGKVGRAYKATFSESEQKLIARYHTKFYRWHLVSGTPRHVMIKPKTIALLKRAVDFFGSI